MSANSYLGRIFFWSPKLHRYIAHGFLGAPAPEAL
jgi:hypothetical protein